MSLREGCVGRQESASMALIACIISGIFSVNSQMTYEKGDSSYLSTLLAAGLSILAFLIIAKVMRLRRVRSLGQLYRLAFGKALAIPFALATLLMLIYAGMLPLTRLLMILKRYVYIEPNVQQVGLYFLLCVLILAWMGFETVARTARLFAVTTVLAFAVTIVTSMPSFQAYRLHPLLGNGVALLCRDALFGIERFFPALMCLLICRRGVQSDENAASAGTLGAAGGGLVTAGMQFCLGMAYPYQMLTGMHAPMYQLSMSSFSGLNQLRADKLLLFFWTAAGMIAGGFYAYAASLFYADAARLKNVRPVAAVTAGMIAALALIGQLNLPWYEQAIDFLWRFAWLFTLLPPMLAATLVLLRKKEGRPQW